MGDGMVTPFAAVDVDLSRFPADPMDHVHSFGDKSVREVIAGVLALPNAITLLDAKNPAHRAAVAQDIILAYKARHPLSMLSPMLEVPGSAIPRLLTRSGAASSLPIPGLFQAAPQAGGDLQPAQGLHTVHVDAVIRDVWAETSVTQTYKLDTEAATEAVFLYPVDELATVFDLAVTVDKVPVACRMMEKIGSHTEFREVVDQGVAAVALEQVQGDIYCVHVGRVPPAANVEVTVKYVSEMPLVGNAIAYVIPMAVAPPDLSPDEEEAESSILGQKRDIDAIVPRRRESYHDALRMHVAFKMSSIVEVIHCPTHRIYGTSLHAKTPIVEAKLQEPVLDKDLVLLITTRAPHEPQLRVEVNETGDPSSVAAVSLDARVPDAFEATEARELLLVVQQGTSMRRQVSEARRVTRELLRLAPHMCRLLRFNMAVFGRNGRGVLWERSVPLTDATRACALEYLDNVLRVDPPPSAPVHYAELQGDTASTAALVRLLEDIAAMPGAEVDGAALARRVILVTDGHFDYASELFEDIAGW